MKLPSIFNIFKKSTAITPSSLFSQELMNVLRSGTSCYVSSSEAYDFYNQISALGDAVDMISDKFSTIKPIIKNSKDEIIENRQVQEILRNPNKLEKYSDFAQNACASYLLATNAYLEVQGFYKSNPIGIYNVAADKVNITEGNSKASYLVTINMFYAFLSGRFELEPTTGRILEPNRIQELYHIKGFNLDSGSLKAISKVSSIKGDIDVLDKTLVQMVSALKKGFSAAGILNVDTDDIKAFEQFKKDMRNHFSGAANTEKAIASMGKSVTYTQIQQNNRDMRQIENKVDSRNTIYQRFNIPSPLVDNSSQTFNNYQVAQFALYDDAVLPVAVKIYGTLTEIFQQRGMLKEDEFITYDEKSIPALQLRTNEQVKLLKETDILSDNELRSKVSYEGYGPDGDIHYKPASMIPVGTDIFTEDNLKDPQKSAYLAMKNAGISSADAKSYWNEYKKAISNN